MRLLVLGGTRSVGHVAAAAAVRRGWRLPPSTCDMSRPDVPGVRLLRDDRAKAADLARAAEEGPWDVAVDT